MLNCRRFIPASILPRIKKLFSVILVEKFEIQIILSIFLMDLQFWYQSIKGWYSNDICVYSLWITTVYTFWISTVFTFWISTVYTFWITTIYTFWITTVYTFWITSVYTFVWLACPLFVAWVVNKSRKRETFYRSNKPLN